MSIINRLFKRKSKRNDEEEFLDDEEEVEIHNHQKENYDVDNEFTDEEDIWDDDNEEQWDNGVGNFQDDVDEEEEEVYVDEDGNVIPPDQLHLYDLGDEEEEEQNTFEEPTLNEENYNEGDLGTDFPSFDDEDENTEQPNYFDFPEDEEEPPLFGNENLSNEPISFSSDIPTSGESVQFDEEIEPSQEKVDINYGHSGLLDATKQSKENIYKEMVYKITDRDIELISKAIQEHDSLWKIFSYLEENNVPLQYGVALEIFTEEEITGYRAYQQRDLIDSETKPIDEVHDTNYIEEIMRERDIILTEPVKQDVPQDKSSNFGKDEHIQEENPVATDSISEKRTPLDIDAVIAQIKERKEKTTEKNTQEEIQEQEVTSEETVEELEVSEELTEEQVIPTEEKTETDSISEDVSLAEIVLPEQAPRNAKVDKILSKGVTNRIKGQKHKKVLVICEGIQLPKFLGKYELIEVTSISDLRVIELSLDNVLVVTSLIPVTYRTGLVKWLNRVNKKDVRVVTLKGYEVQSSVIDRAIDLTEEDLDMYYQDINKKADMTEMGNHRDISRFLGRK